jgi:hypothetical protein
VTNALCNLYDRAVRRFGPGVTCVTALLVSCVGCHAPTVQIDPADATGDAPVADASDGGAPEADVAHCDPVFRADGSVCIGHDEDHDCVPDDCDDCPSIADPDQTPVAVGNACLHHEAPFDRASTRFVFDPFQKVPNWPETLTWPTDKFTLDPSGDAILGGTLDDAPFMRWPDGLEGKTVVATTVVTLLDTIGVAALLLSVEIDGGGHSRTYGCVVDAAGFHPGYVVDPPRCEGTNCPFKYFDVSGAHVVAPIPSALHFGTGVRLGVRASLSGGADGGERDLECRVFDPANPTTLQLASGAGYSLRVKAPPASWIAAPFGLLGQGTSVRFESIDVLVEP